jgi:3-methyladenine DNA glycosylase AlkC
MEPLKEMFNKKFFTELSNEFQRANQNFNVSGFLKDILKDLDQLSLNERLRKTSLVLKKYLPEDFKKSMDMMFKVIPNLETGYTTLVFPDYVGLYGHHDFNRAMEALKYFTKFGSSEFAIREFFKRDFNRTLLVAQKWALDKDVHVRRLASEGSRPRLPWSFKLDEVIKNPHSTALILETLKDDQELYVKKSVANHLNDISKDNPDYMMRVIGKWDQTQANTFWIVKHASRTLIKKGNKNSLAIFNYEKNIKVAVDDFKLSSSRISLGESLEFSFYLNSLKSKTQKLVIDYIVHYQKKAGATSAKVFKLKEILLEPKQSLVISKKQVFRDFSTRKHVNGRHTIEIQINGLVMAKQEFYLHT